MAPTVRNSSNHVVDLSCGQVLGPGETSDRYDPTNDQDVSKVAAGLLSTVGTPVEREISKEARKKAEELDVDLDTVQGTGVNGNVLVKDVEDAAEAEDANEEGDE